MPSNGDWLLAIARSLQQSNKVGDGFVPAERPLEYWPQIARIFRLPIDDLLSAVAEQFNLAIGDAATVDANAARLLPEKTCRELFVVPLHWQDGVLTVGTCSPPDIGQMTPAISFALGCPCEVVYELLLPEAIENILLASFSVQPQESLSLNEVGKSAGDSKDLTVRLARAILRDAIAKRASDVHIQPFAGGGLLRFRIDGLLQRVATIKLEMLENLARFFKVHGKMDPAKKMIAQDGRLRLTQNDIEVDVRLSILPSYGGERIVARLLDQKRIFSMRRSGYSIVDQQAIKRLTAHRAGMVLITGPTGSGKSSTLYSILSDMDRAQQNIMTIENPVEYVLQGISQTEVNVKQGLSFADSLRSILRQDPDVVLVGEIRDQETALIASQAAMTGHLVLSTVHTNDAVSTIPRMLKLGVDASILADSLVGVVAQRLLRRLCPHCKERIDESAFSASERTFHQVTKLMPAYRPVGCEQCHYSGYSGRLPITEIFEVNSAVAELIRQGDVAVEQLLAARSDFKSLSASAVLLIVSGDTSVDEAYRVVGREFWPAAAKAYGSQLPENFVAPEAQRAVKSAVLLISQDAASIAQLTPALKQDDYQVFVAGDAVEAKEILKAHAEITFVVVDVAEQDDDAIVQGMRETRVELYWSKLPALVLLPAGHPGLAERLRADGAVSQLRDKPIMPEQVLADISAYTVGS